VTEIADSSFMWHVKQKFCSVITRMTNSEVFLGYLGADLRAMGTGAVRCD